MRIRPAAADDVPRLLVLLAQLDYTPDPTAVRAGLEAPGTTVLVAEADSGEVAGVLSLVCRPLFHRGATGASIDALVVEAAHRSCGVGEALVTAARRLAAERGAVVLEVDSGLARADAHRFYERLGFELTSNHYRQSLASVGSTAREPGTRVLSGGLVLRAARVGDVDQLAALLAERGDAADATDARLMLADPDQGLEATAVVVDGDRVVSTATLLDETLVLGGVDIPVGQVDLVATAADFEGRGLVRALMEWAHRRSAERGHLAQVMVGIPYFYRQFGYTYAIPGRGWRRLAGPLPPPDPGVVIRRATGVDIPALAALQDQAQAAADLRMTHRPATWRWLLARDGSAQWVAERHGAIVGTARSTPPEEGPLIGEVAADDGAAALALLAALTAGASDELLVQERPGSPAGDALDRLLSPDIEDRPWYLVRVDDLAPLLERLGPVFQARLAATGLDGTRHDVLISTFRSHVRFSIGPDGMSPVERGGAMQAPASRGGSGIPPDAVASLLFGPDGATGLADRLPDCYLGPQEDLMAALFPPVRADLLTFFLPD